MNSWTISRRLSLGFASMVVILLGLAGTFVVDLARINKEVTSLATDSLPGLSLSHQALEETLNLRVQMLRILASRDTAEAKELDQRSTTLFEETAKTLKEYE